MKLKFLSTLIIRFSRIKLKKTKKSLEKFLGDNYPVFNQQGRNLLFR